MIAKLIARGKHRTEAIARMTRALDMFIIDGIHTTILPLQRRILHAPDFRAGNFHTKFMERLLGSGPGK